GDAAGRGKTLRGARCSKAGEIPPSVRRPGVNRRRMDGRVAVAEAELQLMVHRAHVEELRTVEAFLLLRTRRDIGVEVVVIDAACIAPARRGCLALTAVAVQ